jgi:hypothetical protein
LHYVMAFNLAFEATMLVRSHSIVAFPRLELFMVGRATASDTNHLPDQCG